MLRIFGKQGQSALEYSMLVIIVIGALLAMQNYMKRGVQGRLRSSVDGVGEQYDPLQTTVDITQRVVGNTVTSITTQNATGGTETFRNDTSFMTETKTGSSRVDAQ